MKGAGLRPGSIEPGNDQSQKTPPIAVSKIVQATGDLPAMPHIATLVVEKLSDPKAMPRDIYYLITKDQGLAARVLKVANSPYYGASRSISSMRDAVLFMGFDAIRSLIMTAVMKGMFSALGLAEKLLWEHSLASASAARQIATALGIENTEEAFLAGLVHDIGKAVLFLRFPDKMSHIMQEVYNTGASFSDLEQTVLGFTHAQVGQLVADKWRFALNIEDAIANHHQPDQATLPGQLAHVVSLANQMCHKVGIGPTRRPDIEPSELASAKVLGMTPEAIEEILQSLPSAVKEG